MITDPLEKRRSQGLLRNLRVAMPPIDLTSNDYFGFAREERMQKERPGATGSRLLTGNSLLYEELEGKIAEFHRAKSCLIYNSGYTANLGLLSAIGKAETTFLYDLEIHASMIDGMRLSEAKKFPFRHNDLESLENRLQKAKPPVFVLIESIYSMSGQFAPIEEIAALCAHYEAKLIVDEAHATGIFGSQGEGLLCEMDLEPSVFARVHTFSKALGSHGGCVLGSQELREYLINFSRPLIYTTALPPSALVHIAWSYERLKREAPFHQKKLQRLIDYFCAKIGIERTSSPILPIYVGGAEEAKQMSKMLEAQGIDIRPILSPTVRKGKECLRVVLHSFNEEREIDKLIEVLKCKKS